jgi:anti-sigma B factor antagonist
MSENAEAFRAESLQIEASQDRTGATITLKGEFDMTGTERFWSFLSEALAATPRTIAVDTSALEFIDSSGLMALIRARDAAVEAGVGFHVRDPSPALRRIAELSGLEELLRPVGTIRRAQSGCWYPYASGRRCV